MGAREEEEEGGEGGASTAFRLRVRGNDESRSHHVLLRAQDGRCCRARPSPSLSLSLSLPLSLAWGWREGGARARLTSKSTVAPEVGAGGQREEGVSVEVGHEEAEA